MDASLAGKPITFKLGGLVYAGVWDGKCFGGNQIDPVNGKTLHISSMMVSEETVRNGLVSQVGGGTSKEKAHG